VSSGREFHPQGLRLQAAAHEGDVLRLRGKGRLQRCVVAVALGRDHGEAQALVRDRQGKAIDAAIRFEKRTVLAGRCAERYAEAHPAAPAGQVTGTCGDASLALAIVVARAVMGTD
jgi:hypothetical protein